MNKALEIVLSVHIGIVAAVIPLLVRVLSLKRMLQIFAPPPLFKPYRHLPAENLIHAVKNRLKRPMCMVRRACLREGFLIFHFLRLAGLESTIHISIYPRDMFGRSHAHCWVTSSGRTVSSPPGPEMVTLFSYPNGD
jgi:hypothetical protein